MGRINVTPSIFAGASAPNLQSLSNAGHMTGPYAITRPRTPATALERSPVSTTHGPAKVAQSTLRLRISASQLRCLPRCAVWLDRSEELKKDTEGTLLTLTLHLAYLLGLLAMIKCSICSYQCDN